MRGQIDDKSLKEPSTGKIIDYDHNTREKLKQKPPTTAFKMRVLRYMDS